MKKVTIAISESSRDYLDELKRKHKLKSMEDLFIVLIPHIKESIKTGDLEVFNNKT